MPFSQLTPQWVFSFICCGAYIIFPPPISAFFSAAPLLAAVLLCSAAPQLPQKLFAHIKFVTRVPKVAVFEDLGGKAGPIATIRLFAFLFRCVGKFMLAWFIVRQQAKHFGELLPPVNRSCRWAGSTAPSQWVSGRLQRGIILVIYPGAWPHNCNCSFRYLELQSAAFKHS